MPYEYKDSNKEHLHVLEGKPLYGTSTVVGIIAKPLTWWAVGLALAKLGWINAKVKIGGKYVTNSSEKRIAALTPKFDSIKNMTVEQFLTLLDLAYRAHVDNMKETASAGIDLHAELERYVKHKMYQTNEIVPFSEKIYPFIEWSEKNVRRFLWSEGNCYSREIWCGGISDCGAELMDGSYGIIDFKSSKEAYTSQFIQAGGYDIEISENGILTPSGECKWKPDKPFSWYAVVPFGAEKVEPVIRLDVDGLKEGFRAALTLHKLVNI